MAPGASAGRVQRDVLLNNIGLVAAGIVLERVASSCGGTSSFDHFSSPRLPGTRPYGGMILLLDVVALVSDYMPHEELRAHEP